MDFQKSVIEASKEKPVVVDFWAPWCGPCKYLGPVIEELAEESDLWKLVKVNTDEETDLATQYKIKGIPAVKMFFKGEVIAEFTGALPKPQIEKWLEEHLPDERKDDISALIEEWKNGKDISGRAEDIVTANQDFDEGKILLAQVLVFSDPGRSKDLISNLKTPMRFVGQVEELKNLITFMTCDLKGSPLSEKINKARVYSAAKQWDQAIEALIEVVMVDKSFCDEMPRKATIAFFHLLGDQHELTKKHRRRFDMALY